MSRVLENGLVAAAPVVPITQQAPEDEAFELTVANLGVFKRLSRAFTRGVLTHESGTLGYEMMGSPGPEVAKQQEEISNRITELGDDGPGFVGWLGSAAEIAGQQYASMVAPFSEAKEAFTDLGNTEGNPLVKIGRAAGAVQGLLAPPVAFTMDAFKAEAGSSYVESIEAGVDPTTAKLTAHVVGTLNAGLEAAGLTGAAAPLATASKNLLKVGVRKVANDPRVLAAAGRVVGAYGASIGSEVLTEVMQESVTIAALELGKAVSPEALEAMTAEEIQERLIGVAVKTFKGMSVLAAPGAAAQFGVEVQRARNAKIVQGNLDKVKEVLDNAPDPVVAGEQLTTSLIEAGTDHMFISADGLVATANASGDPMNFYGRLGIDPARVDEAALLGGDVRIDPKQFTQIAMGDDWEALKYHIRLDEDDMTASEATEFENEPLDTEIEAAEAAQAELPEDFIPLADEVGKPVVLYHGTTQAFEEFTVTPDRGERGDALGEGFYFTSDPNFAGAHAKESVSEARAAGRGFKTEFKPGANVRPVYVALKNPLIHQPSMPTGKALSDMAKEQGYDGIIFNTNRKFQEVVVFDPKAIKSIFDETVNENFFGLQGFFKNAKDAGMTDKQYETYLGSLQRAADSKNSAKERIRLRKLERETREEIKTIKAQLAEVARESVDNQPVYGAINALEGRERLNKEKLESLGIDPASLPKARGRQIYEKGGTVDPEVFAELWGFEGADVMAFSMMDATPREQAIQQETDRLFNEQYVGLNAKQQEIEADIEALHNDSQAAVIALELNQLREAVGQKKLKPRLLKVAARDRLRDFPLKEINPKKYLVAERREARTAAKLLRKGDRQGAAKAKFRQLLNFQFAMEAYRVREKTKSQHKYLRKFSKRAKPNAKLPIDYFLAIQTMLGEIDLKRSRPSLVDFVVSKQVNEGIVLNIPMQVQVDNGKTNYLDLSLRRWEQMVETVKEVEKKGLDENKFLREQEKQTRDEAAKAVADNVRANLKMRQGEELGTRWDEAKKFGRDMALLTTNTDTLVREVDGFESLGSAHNYIKRPYNLAMTTGYHPGQIGFIAREQKESKRLVKLVDVFTKSEQLGMKKRIQIPGVKSSKMSHERVIMTLMNVGNLENRKALVDGGPLTDPEVDAIVAYASKKDWDFVQSIWDYFEEFWPEIVESSKRRRNVIPTKVEATPIETPHGTYRGGYFPLMYSFHEVAMTELATTGDVAKLLEVMRTGRFEQSQTKHGHTLEREASGKRQVRLDLFNINAHLNQVVYDLEVGDAVMDIFKIIRAPAVRDAFKETGNSQRWEALNLWFGDIVLGEQHFHDGWSRLWRHLRTGFTISKIGFNLMTVALQPLGLVNTMTQVGKQNTLVALMSAMFNPRAAMYVGQTTPFMKQRSATYNHDIIAAQQAFKASMLRKVTPGNSAEVASRWSFYALIKMQRVVDTVTWMAAKRDGQAKFGGTGQTPSQDLSRFTQTGFHGSLDVIEKFDIGRSHLRKESGKAAIYLSSDPKLANRFAMREATDEDPAIFADDPDFFNKVKGLINNKEGSQFEAEYKEWKQLEADQELLNETESDRFQELYEKMVDWGKRASIYLDEEGQTTKRPNMSKIRVAPGKQLTVDMEGKWDWDQEADAIEKAKAGGYDSVKMTDTGMGDITAVFNSADVMFESDFQRNEQGRLTSAEIERKANEYADNMVARSQSSGMFGYRTPLERGTTSRRSQQNELTKLMVPLMSYYLAKANVAYERIRRTNPRSPLQVIDLAVDLTIMTIGEALLAAMIMGDWPDDEDDLLGFVGFQWVKSAAAMVPGARDVVSVAEGFTGGGVPASVMAEMGAFFAQANQGEIDAAFFRSLAKVTGTLARIPGMSQGIRTSRAVEAESENPIEYITGPPYEN